MRAVEITIALSRKRFQVRDHQVRSPAFGVKARSCADDLDGTELAGDDVEQMHFSLDGVAYVIDLSQANADTLRGAFGRYTDAARRDQAVTRGGSAGKSAAPKAEGRKDLEQVRAWANENGHPVSTRGRVPNAVLEAYDAR